MGGGCRSQMSACRKTRNTYFIDTDTKFTSMFTHITDCLLCIIQWYFFMFIWHSVF